MNRSILQIQSILNDYLSPGLINDVILPHDLKNPTTQEDGRERLYFMYHKLIGPLCVHIAGSLGRELSKTELGFIAERLQSFLKEKGF